MLKLSKYIKICAFKLFAKFHENQMKNNWVSLNVFRKYELYWCLTPHYNVIESCFRLNILKYFKMIVFKLSANFFENSTSNGQYFNFFIKYWISRCWTPSPLWRHTIAIFSSRVQNMLKYIYLNFLPNFVKTGRKMTDFWEIFHKISNFQMLHPLLWRHRGLKIIENF